MTTGNYCHLTGKVAYDEPHEAGDVMRSMKSRRRSPGGRKTDRLCVFKCDACGYWHVGNRNKERRSRHG